MKIGIYDPYLDDLGGGEKYMMTIAQCLSHDNNVDVFWDNPSDLSLLLKRFSLDLSKVNIVSNIFSSKISTLERLISTRKYDIIVFLSNGSIPLVSSRLYVHIQEPLGQFQNSSRVEKLKLNRVSAFFCNSQYTKKFIDKKFFLKTSILYPPITIRVKKIKKENIILHVGRFRVRNIKNGDYKKQRIMIDAFKNMVDKGFRDWKLVLAVGVGDREKKEFGVIKESTKGYPIELLVNKSNDELWDIYSKAKIYWHATGYGEDLEKNPEFAEHFGISTVEAMGAGAVPVVINTGGQVEIIKNGENGFLWNTLEELKDKTILLTKDQNLLEKLSKNAISRSKYFEENNFCKRVEELIK